MSEAKCERHLAIPEIRRFEMKLSAQKRARTIVTFIVLMLLQMVLITDGVAVSKKELRRVSDEGPVEITVLYLNPVDQEQGEDPAFEVRMETHTVDLDGYQVDQLSSLEVDGKGLEPLGWLDPGGGGHHISGTLKYKGPLPDGARILRLTMRDIGSVAERVFEWTLPID
jgi:hypothetical protein